MLMNPHKIDPRAVEAQRVIRLLLHHIPRCGVNKPKPVSSGEWIWLIGGPLLSHSPIIVTPAHRLQSTPRNGTPTADYNSSKLNQKCSQKVQFSRQITQPVPASRHDLQPKLM
jgi:hypothetical protein